MAAREHDQRLEEDSIRLRAVLDSMGEGLIAIDANGMITAVNPYAVNALGFTEHELLGAWFNEAVVSVDHHREPLEHLSRPVVKALTTGEAVSGYSYYLRKDGSMMPVFLSVAPIINDGRPDGAIEVFRDITADRQLDLAKDEFVSLASHQLRTPASGVKAILSMVIAGDFGPLTPDQDRYLRRAFEGNNRQIQIIEDILNAARVDSGQMELELEQVDLVTVTNEVMSELASDFASRDQRQSLTAPHELRVWGDPGKLRMALDNLLGNASKYTPVGGQIAVTIGIRDDIARISISDTGVGIPAKDLPKLFNKFIRIENELAQQAGGTGLGLYLARSIAELHRGSLTVESVVGQGSTFHLVLPIGLVS